MADFLVKKVNKDLSDPVGIKIWLQLRLYTITLNYPLIQGKRKNKDINSWQIIWHLSPGPLRGAV